ncbi:type IV pilus modification protein PilV [Undibacterium arcticum]|uniref:Type IV pilus modification protein PilV n=1 Tax=Undibacterium arcticum TaxID=1762892 RepID=A0ABV7FBF5_9BURK
MKTRPKISPKQSGFGMIEVLVTLVILLLGLLGLVGMMLVSQRAEMESYQRVQALMLLQDMVGRVNANRKVASCYAITTGAATGAPYLGASSSITTPTCTTGTAEQNSLAIKDMQDWNALLLGGAESAGGNAVGAMIGARGCVSLDAATGIYQVSVAWQGNGQTAAPTGVVCAKDQYGDDKQRRAVSVTLRIADLS